MLYSIVTYSFVYHNDYIHNFLCCASYSLKLIKKLEADPHVIIPYLKSRSHFHPKKVWIPAKKKIFSTPVSQKYFLVVIAKLNSNFNFNFNLS